MYEAAISRLYETYRSHAWVRELAGFLPLSALIDFADNSHKLHVLELAGTVPLWSWTVTPDVSSVLLSEDGAQRTCCLDRHGSSVALNGLDGRNGDHYVLSSPETVRMCVSSQKTYSIANDHVNMNEKDLKIQKLEIVHVSRLQQNDRPRQSRSELRQMVSSHEHLFVSAIGWIVLLGMIAMSGIFQCYLSFTFLVAIPTTGIVIFCLCGSTPRRLHVESPGEFKRLIIVAEHMNTAEWTVFYGESTILNSLLDRPLELSGPQISAIAFVLLRMALRILIVGQWSLALGAAVRKDWNAYFVSFWIAFTVFSHIYLVPPLLLTDRWMKRRARIGLMRYQTKLSSRRALLNTIVALNPDTFCYNEDETEDRTTLRSNNMKYIDPILAPGSDRTEWEAATRTAMYELANSPGYQTPLDILASLKWKGMKGADDLSKTWNDAYPLEKKKPILEGIYMAAKIRQEAQLPGQKLTKIV